MNINILKQVAKFCQQVKVKDCSKYAISYAPNEVYKLQDTVLGKKFIIIAATDWCQKEDREVNFDLGEVNGFDKNVYYQSLYKRALSVIDMLTEKARKDYKEKYIIGGFSQGGAVAQIVGAYLGVPTYAIGSSKPTVKTKHYNNINVLNHHQDYIRLLPLGGKNMGYEYFLSNKAGKALVKVGNIAKVYDFLFRKKKFDAQVHDEEFYMQLIERL